MPCVNPDGRPTETGRMILRMIAAGPRAAEEISTQMGLPLFRVRSGLRELEAAELAVGNDETYIATEKGAALAG